MTQPEKYTVLCARIQDHLEPVAGSRSTRCARCGVGVWVAPTTDLITAGTILEAVCHSCLSPMEAMEIREHVRRGPLPQQVDEVVADLLRRRMAGD